MYNRNDESMTIYQTQALCNVVVISFLLVADSAPVFFLQLINDASGNVFAVQSEI
jgi:hypothetical protein